jgi:hypothetical protein
VIEQESGSATSGDTASHPFGKGLYKLAKRIKCLRDISKAEAKRFDDLWNGGQNKILDLDGKIRYTRGWVTTVMTQRASRSPSMNIVHLK